MRPTPNRLLAPLLALALGVMAPLDAHGQEPSDRPADAGFSERVDVEIVNGGEPATFPLNRVAKTDYVALKDMAAAEVASLRDEGLWDKS